jgi:DNA modification methylase
MAGPQLAWPGKAAPAPGKSVAWGLSAIAGERRSPTVVPDPTMNHLVQGDNLAHLQGLVTAGWAGRLDLVYLDPPFDSGADYHRTVRQRGARGRSDRQLAYRDVWAASDYLQFMYERLLILRDLLSDTGSLFLHCDFRRVHHLRCLLDEMFGPHRFRNQIVWAYGGGARGAKAVAGQFPRNHDVILWYGKGDTVPYAPIQVERRVPLAEARAAGFRQDDHGNWFKTAPRGDYTDASVARLDAEGRIHRTRTGSVRIKYPLRHDADSVIEDVTVGDVWTDIPDAMHASRRERFDYPTRKPVALLERLILAATKPGDWVLDAFCGSGTTLVAAERHRRRWVGLDVNPVAIEVAARRVLTESRARSGPGASNPVPVAIWRGDGAEAERNAPGLAIEARLEAGAVTVSVAMAADGEGAAASGDWRSTVDAIYLDPAYDGHVFRRQVADVPAIRDERVSGDYELPAAHVGETIAVQVVDVYGGIVTATIPAPSKRSKRVTTAKSARQ